MNVLSLFDGMACARIALDRASIKVDNYYASEVDKYAMKVSAANYPDIIQLGDVTKWREWDLPEIDLIIGGSPCQGFSFAGKQLAFDEPRSKLFFEFVNILEHVKPKYFILENVRMQKEHEDVITKTLGVEPVCINSALLSAQNRVRYYWANFGITQPKDKQIFLKDIIENGFVDTGKSYCIDACYHKGGDLNQYFNKSRRQVVFNLSDNNRVAGVTITSEGIRPYQKDERKSELSEIGIIAFPESKTSAMITNHPPKVFCGKSNISNRQMNKNIRKLCEKGKALTSSSSGNMTGQGCTIISHNNINYRKLAPLECERLQTVDDNFTAHVSNTQRYRMLGNGFTVDVIAHILGCLHNDKIQQSYLF